MSEATPSRRPVRVVSIGANAEHYIRFLGPYRGLMTHWVGGRPRGHSIPCQGDGNCPPGVHRSRSLWKGYAPAEEWCQGHGLWEPCVLEVTEALEEVLRPRQLAGEVWLLARPQPGAKTMPVIGNYLEGTVAELLRPPFDVEPILRRFYHVQVVLLDVPNPIPSRTYLEPSALPPPVVLTFPQPESEKPATREQWQALRDRFRLNQAAEQAKKGNGYQPPYQKGTQR